MTIQAVRNFRRLVQGAVFALFVFLLLKTGFAGTISTDALKDYRLFFPVRIFLQFDPLASLTTALSSLTLFSGLIWSLIIIVLTIFLGRFFCGWLCPLGTLNQMLSTFKSERKSRLGSRLIESNRYHAYQRIKFYVLIFCLGSALLGLTVAGILDPISLLIRSLGLVVLPVLAKLLSAASAFMFNQSLPGDDTLGFMAQWLKTHVLLTPAAPIINTVFSLGLFFLLVLLANRIYTSFWCRGICPLGALLGLVSRWSILGLQKKEAACDHCNQCLVHCQGADGPEAGVKWRKSECHLCLNCQAACDRGALQFRFFPQSVTQIEQGASLTRRKLLASAVGGVAAAALFQVQPASAKPNPLLIRPPGATAEDLFQARCIRCGECMKVCPTNAIHPTLLEAGWEAIWSPLLIMRVGYCEPSCTLCGQVCPTGAIRELTLQEKVGGEGVEPVKIGAAFFDRGRCLPWAEATACQVCHEWCPTSPKAIFTNPEEAVNARGETIVVARPYVNLELCTGCGACEYACPVVDRAAVYVTSIGESRSKTNQVLLKGKEANGAI